jgi:hypothetical protein
MNINRRKLIMFLGSLLGVGSAIYFYQSDKPKDNQFVNISEPEQPLQPLKIAPEGLFAPVKGDVRLVIMSDLNSRYGSTTYEPQVTQAVGLIPQWKPDLILCVGDMVAGQKLSLSEANIQAMTASSQTRRINQNQATVAKSNRVTSPTTSKAKS